MVSKNDNPGGVRDETADALRQSEQRLRHIFHQTTAGIAQVDLSGRFVLVNQRFCDITGYSAEELRTKTCSDLTHPDEKARNDEMFLQALRTRKPYAIEKRYVRPDGSPVWVRNNVSEIVDDEGQLRHLLAICIDITERKQAEYLLREQKQLLELIASGCPREECLTALTEAVSRLHPTARAAVLIANAERTALGDAYAAHLHPSFGDGVRGAPICELAIGTCGLAIYEGKPITCPDLANSERWSRAWRDLCLAHGIRACHSMPVILPDGQAVASFFLCFADTRTPSVWESHLAESGARLASIVLERDRSAQMLRQNEVELAAELADLKLLRDISTELIHEENSEALYARIVEAAAALMRSDCASIQMFYPERGAGELRLLAFRGFDPQAARLWEWVRADTTTSCGIALHRGERVIVPDAEQCDFMAGTDDLAMYHQNGIRAVQSTPLISRGGKIIGMISTHWRLPYQPAERYLRLLDLLARQAADLLERTQTEETLRQADRRKDEFLATLAHELRNPLAPLRNGLQILRRSNLSDPAARRVEMMERQVDHMVRLVEDLLEVSRITRGAIELRKERVELSVIIRNAVESCKPLFDSAGHQLAIHLPAEPLTLEADPVRLAQILANLLNNAAKYTEAGGRIWLSARAEGDEAVLSVRDTGLGIPAEMLSRVFEMFTQINRDLKRDRGGLGIGLTLVKNLVELHGGRVEAHSEGSEKGSEFVVRLPLSANLFAAASAFETEAPPPNGLAPRRVLVVDDNREAADSLGELLTLLGAEVRIAFDGPSALEMVSAHRPEIVLLDIGMPGMDGCEVARRLRQNAELRGMRLIALTGWGQEEDRRRTREAGFDHHLIKPIQTSDLQSLLTATKNSH